MAKVTTQKLAKAADQLYEVRQQRLAVAKEVEVLKKKESELQNFLIDNLPVSEASGVAGNVARVQIVPASTPTVEDWDAFYKYVYKKKAFHLLQKRVSEKAVEELWEDGKEVSGVVAFNYKKVSLTKV